MRFIATKSNWPLSLFIRAVTGQDCSHFAMHFPLAKTVIHSNLLGVREVSEANFFEGSLQVMHSVESPLTLGITQEREAADLMMAKIGGDPYDFMGAIYAGIRILLFRLLRMPIPVKNAWASRGKEFCTRIYDVSPDNLIPVVPSLEDTEMVTPHELVMGLSEAFNAAIPNH